MILLSILVVLALETPAQTAKADRAESQQGTPDYRKLQKGEAAIEGLLQRVECPHGRPVVFTMRVKDAVERFESPQLSDVDYISYTPTFKGRMTCGGRGKGDLVRLTWKKAGSTRRAVAIEFLPGKKGA